MIVAPGSPAQRKGVCPDVLVPLVLSALAMPFGLFLPIVAFTRWAGMSENTYSVATGILDLFRSGQVSIGLIILTFSFLFPIVKLAALYVLWFRTVDAEALKNALRSLSFLGKWSMLDVFVVGILVGTLNLGLLAGTYPKPGLYVFSGAVLLSLVATLRVARRMSGDVPQGPRDKRPNPATLPLGILSLLLTGAGLELPLMSVDKWTFWKNDYSVLRATFEMFRGGQAILGLMVLAFVVAAPLLKSACAVALWLVRSSRKERVRLRRALRHLEKWAMADVFALGLIVVLVKIGGVVNVYPGPGLWCFFAGAALSVALTWLNEA